MTAPVVPLYSDWIHRSLVGGATVHLAGFPVADTDAIDDDLEREMDAVRALVSLGRAAREEVRIRVRQPLRTLHAVIPGDIEPREALVDVLKEELNVKEVRFLASADALVTLAARPNFRTLGPRFQAESEGAASAIRMLDDDRLRAFQRGEPVRITVGAEEVELDPEWLEIVEESVGELVVKTHDGHSVALDPTLDDDLRSEGMARELVNRIQRLRKDAGLEITDRILLGIDGSDAVREALSRFQTLIAHETLALEVADRSDAAEWEAVLEDEIDGSRVRVALTRAG